MRRWRTLRRLPGIARAAACDWRVSAATGRAPAPELSATLDLSRPAAFAGDVPVARTSAAVDGTPLALRLPAGRGLELPVRQVLARRDAAGAVAQVVVKLPSVPAAEAPALVERVAAEVGAPARRSSSLARRPQEVFRTAVGDAVELGGFLRAEVQVEHHLDEGRVAVDLLLAPRASA